MPSFPNRVRKRSTFSAKRRAPSSFWARAGKWVCTFALLKRAFLDLDRTDPIYAASRFQSLRDASVYEQLGVHVLKGDFRDDEFVRSLPHCPTVFYLVGTKFGTSNNSQLLREINVEVARELAYHYRSSKIVALSTGCVYSYVSPQSGGSTEDSPMNPIGEYARSCLEREEQFQEISRKRDTPVALIRLNYSVEFRYGVLLDIGEKVFNGEPVDLNMSHVNVIWQNDALNHTVQSLEIANSAYCPDQYHWSGYAKCARAGGGFWSAFWKEYSICWHRSRIHVVEQRLQVA